MDRLIFYRPASFAGRHNAVKVKCFLFMSQNGNAGRGWTPGELSSELGLSEGSLYVLLARWHSWGYVTRVNTKRGYRYTIKQHGRDWLLRNGTFAPIDTYIKEIEAYRAKRRQLLAGK